MRCKSLLSKFVLILLATLLASPTFAHAALPKKPNFVVFLSDDHGWWDSTVYGATDVQTPNMQRLAGDGMTFTHCFVASPACAPSRAALLTGLMPARNGAEANHTFSRGGIKTLPAYLQQLGYEVAAFGKVAHGRDAGRHGFDHYSPKYTDSVVAQYLAERLGHKPLCLFVGTHQPHVPWPKNDGYDPAKLRIPPSHVDTPETREYRARYYTDVSVADTELGQIYDLARKQLGENTLFIYTSDHGAQWPLGKWNLYDAGIRSPLIVAWPGVIKRGRNSNALTSWIDLLPTLIELAGGSPSNELDGRSFASVLRGEADRHRDVVFATHSGDGRMNVYPIRCVRNQRFKYILNLRPDCRHTTHFDLARDVDGLAVWQSWERAAKTDDHAAETVRRYAQRPREELYDVQSDPYELKNLVDSPEHRETLGQLRSKLQSWMERQKDTKRVFQQPYLLTEPKPVPIGVREAPTRNGLRGKGKIKAAAWRYTISRPPADWYKPGYNDSQWKTGVAGFGRIKQPAARVQTRWTASDIWLRRTFDLKRLPDKPALRIFHDEDAEVYLNGVEIGRFAGFTSKYILVPLEQEDAKLLRVGNNLLAVHCRQTRGGQYIDVSVVDAAGKDVIRPTSTTATASGPAPVATRWRDRVTVDNVWPQYPRSQLVRAAGSSGGDTPQTHRPGHGRRRITTTRPGEKVMAHSALWIMNPWR
jgi:arylsulfatase A-like enzyme